MVTQAARPRLCLLVEDDAVVGLSLAATLEHHGYFVAGPFTVGAEALSWLDRFTPDVALVDLNLRDGLCGALVAELRRLAVPFAIHSGVRAEEMRRSPFRGATWLTKPTPNVEVLRTMARLAAGSTRSVQQID